MAGRAITQAILLAAGLGEGMRPLTDATPKPLLPLGGRALIDHALDRLAAAGIVRVVVNSHWPAERLARHLAARPGPLTTLMRHEPRLLGPAGAVAAALADGALAPEPFFIVNGDIFWLDGPIPALARLAEGFDPGERDGLLLLHRSVQVGGTAGTGDFFLDPFGALRRRGEREVAPFVFAGVQAAWAGLFDGAGDDGVVQMTPFWNRALEAGRLSGLVHDGLWFHLSMPADLAEAESSLSTLATGRTR